MKNRKGRRIGNEKILDEKATTYSSELCKVFLLKRSLIDCNKALHREKTNHHIPEHNAFTYFYMLQ